MAEKLKDNDFFCCKELLKLLNDPEIAIEYYAVLRTFYLYDTLIYHCPMCSKQFPSELADFYTEVLSTEFDITHEKYGYLEYEAMIPKEFKSNEWWQKRQHDPNFPPLYLAKEEREKKRLCLLIERYLPEDQPKIIQEILAQEQKLEAKKGLFCCTTFWTRIYTYPEVDYRPLFSTRSLVTYEPEKRRCMLKNMATREEFNFKLRQPKSRLRYMFFYCVDCGSPLPKSLAKEWFEIVTKQFGVKDVFNRKELEQKLPPKYLNEEWWREAGL